MPDALPALLALFSGAFLSATLLPGASEAALVALIVAEIAEPWFLVLVAGLGNTLGSATNYALGRLALRFRDRPWFPAGAAQLARAERLFGRWGAPALLFSWLPVVGDALTVAAGVLRVPFGRFLLLVAIGKLARYAAVALGTDLLTR